MSDAESQPVEGVLASAGPTQREMFRYSALRAAIDVAKQIPSTAGADVNGHTRVILGMADEIYAWLTADTGASPA